MQTRFNKTALVIIDVQNDFCPGGSLAVADGDQVVDVINRLMPEFPLIVSTQDWHPADHISFASQGGPWPSHCVQGTPGAELHPGLQQNRIDVRLRKASVDTDAYSGFEAIDDRGKTFNEVLRSRGIERLCVTGLATDYCVRFTTLDALKAGYEVWVVTDAVRAVNVNPDDGARALAEMSADGAHLVTSSDLMERGKGTSSRA